MDEIRPITGWFTKNISKLSSLLMGTRGPPRGECVLPQLLPLCNKPCLEVLDQFSICCFIVHFTRLIEEASAILRRLEFHFGSHFTFKSTSFVSMFLFRASYFLYQLKDKLSEMPGLIHFLWHFFEKKNTFISHFVLFWSDCSPRTQ